MEVHSWAWIFFISFVILASLLVINILIAIIINSMEEVHDVERAEERKRRDEEAAASNEATVAERLEEARRSLDRLEAQLAEGAGDLPGPARSVKRPTKGGRMRA